MPTKKQPTPPERQITISDQYTIGLLLAEQKRTGEVRLTAIACRLINERLTTRDEKRAA